MMRKIGSIACVILVSYVLGLILARQISPEKSTAALQDDQVPSPVNDLDVATSPIVLENENAPQTQGLSIHSAANAFASGDGRLLADDAAGASREYEILLEHAPNGMSDPLRYRIALCAESLGDLDRATSEYQRLVSGCSNTRIALAAQLGQARIWRESNRPLDARRAVWGLLLSSRAGDRDSEEFRAEYVHQLGQLLADRTAGPQQGELLSDLAIVDPLIQRSLRQALRWTVEDSGNVETHVSDMGKAENDEDIPVRLTQQFGPRAEETYLTANLPQMPVAAVVELLAGKASLQAEWSSAARDRVSEHTVRIAVPEIALAILLDGVSDLMDLVWVGTDGTIRMQTREESGSEVTRRFDMAVAERMLRRATAAFPDHELADDAYWALGNIGVRRGQWEAAILQYGQFLRQFSRSDARVGVHFNLAKTWLLRNDREQAMQHFYHVVDAAPSGRLQTIALLYLGRLYLEDDKTKRAIRPLTRSLARARDDVSRATSAIGLASTYLLLDNPHAASRILMTHRSAFSQGPHYDQAAMLAALARHQTATTPAQLEKEGRPLLDAVTHIQAADFFGSYGLVLLAEAQGRLGLFESAQSTLLQGMEIVPQGGLRSRILYALAENHHDAGNLGKCKELLTLLAIDVDDAWADRAKLRLAEVLNTEGDHEQCLTICRELLRGTSQTVDQKKTLRLMGRAFERQGSHRAAALCFAGIEPGIPTTGQQRTIH